MEFCLSVCFVLFHFFLRGHYGAGGLIHIGVFGAGHSSRLCAGCILLFPSVPPAEAAGPG